MKIVTKSEKYEWQSNLKLSYHFISTLGWLQEEEITYLYLNTHCQQEKPRCSQRDANLSKLEWKGRILERSYILNKLLEGARNTLARKLFYFGGPSNNKLWPNCFLDVRTGGKMGKIEKHTVWFAISGVPGLKELSSINVQESIYQCEYTLANSRQPITGE